MKKTLIISCLCMLCSGIMAEETAYFRIILSSASQTRNKVKLTEDNDPQYTNDFQDGSDSPKIMSLANTKSVLIFGIVGTHYCDGVVDNNLEGREIGIQTNSKDEDYTISFEEITGRPFKFVDHFGISDGNGGFRDSIMDISAATTYNFKAAKESLITNRFQIYKPYTPEPGEWYGCFMEDNKLYIYNNPYSANIVITDVTGAEVKSVAPTATPQTIDLSDLTAGNYNVILGNGQKELVINVK